MSTEEQKIKAELAAAEATLKADLAKGAAAEANATTWVKVHFVWLAAGAGALLGFIAGRLIGHL